MLQMKHFNLLFEQPILAFDFEESPNKPYKAAHY